MCIESPRRTAGRYAWTHVAGYCTRHNAPRRARAGPGAGGAARRRISLRRAPGQSWMARTHAPRRTERASVRARSSGLSETITHARVAAPAPPRRVKARNLRRTCAGHRDCTRHAGVPEPWSPSRYVNYGKAVFGCQCPTWRPGAATRARHRLGACQ